MNMRNEVSVTDREGGIRIWLVDDSESFRCLLADFLDSEDGFQIERQFPSAEAVITALADTAPPDVILMDLNMGDGITGVQAVRPIKAIATSTRVFILTAFSDWEGKTQALRDGASDFLLKSCPLTIPNHIRLALARPCGMTSVADEVEFVETNSLSYRRAPETNGQSTDGVARSHPQGCRKPSRRCSSSRLARGVHYLRSLFQWGRGRKREEEPSIDLRSVSESSSSN